MSPRHQNTSKWFVLVYSLMFFVTIQSISDDESNNKHIKQFKSKLTFLDVLIQDVLPSLLGQQGANVHGSSANFAKFELNENDNDDLVNMSTEELIKTAGFKLETYRSVSEDGYITKLLRIVNPYVRRRLLKWPPVVLIHGGNIDQSCYVLSSTNRHHPEKYPRMPGDKPISSWNRSLAFVLANNGYDVWLPASRGSNLVEADHMKLHENSYQVNDTQNQEDLLAHKHKNSINFEIEHSAKLDEINYWNYTQDDIVDYEFSSQIDTVIKVASKNWPVKRWKQEPRVSFLGFSLTAPSTLAFLTKDPEYSKKYIHSYIIMGAPINKAGLLPVPKLLLTLVCPLLPDFIGQAFFKHVSSSTSHAVLNELSKSKKFRYTFLKALSVILWGPSPKYKTLLERNAVAHTLTGLGFRVAKQLCQQLKSDHLQKYDYGFVKNLKIYGEPNPPVYDISNIGVKRWMLLGAENDGIAGPKAIEYLVKNVGPKVKTVRIIPDFDHFDFIGALENGRLVNLPILEFLDSVSFRPSV